MVVGVGVVAAVAAIFVVVTVKGGTSPATDTSSAVCEAARLARNGDREAAQRRFDDAHSELHELAAAATERDRGSATRMLEAKYAVELDLESGSDQLAGDLDRLCDETGSQ